MDCFEKYTVKHLQSTFSGLLKDRPNDRLLVIYLRYLTYGRLFFLD